MEIKRIPFQVLERQTLTVKKESYTILIKETTSELRLPNQQKDLITTQHWVSMYRFDCDAEFALGFI